MGIKMMPKRYMLSLQVIRVRNQDSSVHSPNMKLDHTSTFTGANREIGLEGCAVKARGAGGDTPYRCGGADVDV